MISRSTVYQMARVVLLIGGVATPFAVGAMTAHVPRATGLLAAAAAIGYAAIAVSRPGVSLLSAAVFGAAQAAAVWHGWLLAARGGNALFALGVSGGLWLTATLWVVAVVGIPFVGGSDSEDSGPTVVDSEVSL